MDIARGITAAAFVGGLALGLAAPAGAWGPAGPAPFPADFQTDGHYIGTQIDPKTGQPKTIEGRPVTNDWYFSPCGDGCVSAAHSPGGPPVGQYNLVNGQWAMDTTDEAECTDGTKVPNAIAAHRTFDPNTLAGTIQETGILPACGNPSGMSRTVNFQFQLVP
jgi:hypothetical protein